MLRIDAAHVEFGQSAGAVPRRWLSPSNGTERRRHWPARCNFARSVEYSQAWEHEFFVCEGRSLAIPHRPQWHGPSSFLEAPWPRF